MGKVDHADQMIGLYDLDRKSRNWGRKVFFYLLLTAVYNSYIIFCETNHKRIPYIQYSINLAESMIEVGRNKTKKRKTTKRVGRHSASFRKINAAGTGEHLPLKHKSRQRCIGAPLEKLKNEPTWCVRVAVCHFARNALLHTTAKILQATTFLRDNLSANFERFFFSLYAFCETFQCYEIRVDLFEKWISFRATNGKPSCDF